MIVNYGFKNDIDLPKALSLLREQGVDLNPMTTSYFLSRDIVTPTLGAAWRCGVKSCLPRCTTAPARRRSS